MEKKMRIENFDQFNFYGVHERSIQFQKKQWPESTMNYTDPPVEETEEEQKEEQLNGKDCCRKATKIMFSHVGTLLMVILYIVMGGFLFVYLELENEKNVCVQRYQKYEAKLNESQKRTVAIVQVGSSSNENETSQRVREELKKFAGDVFTLSVDPSKSCSTIGESGNPPDWSIINSMYFCATIVTTIGELLRSVN